MEAYRQDEISAGLPLQSERVALRLMRRDDVDAMGHWPFYLDPFFSRASRMPTTKMGKDNWWRNNFNPPYWVMLAAENRRTGQLIGRVTITLVDKPGGEGVMGVRIKPNLESKGYGTEMIRLFLEYWFIHREMEILTFDANALNRQALRCYEKVGIDPVGYHYEYLPQYTSEAEAHPSGFFKFIDFRLTRDQYLRTLRLVSLVSIEA